MATGVSRETSGGSSVLVALGLDEQRTVVRPAQLSGNGAAGGFRICAFHVKHET
jgi:hypothetical protein